MKGRYHLYLGKAGHLYAMSEFLTRGWNVAIPEVDVGDDIFVVQDDTGILRRVQVKTSTSTPRQKGFSAQFSIQINQLQKQVLSFPVYYVFVVRKQDGWTKPVIIRQDFLLSYYSEGQLGSQQASVLNLYFAYADNKVECSGLDFSAHLADFSDFPIIN